MTNNTIKIKLNANLNGFKKGQILQIKVDKYGVPVHNYWYRRLKDSEIDNCIEIVEEKTNKNYPNKKNKKEDTVNEYHET